MSALIARMPDQVDEAELLQAAERARGVRAARLALIARPVFECLDCGEPILPARKAAFPAARRCAPCQAMAEAEALRARRAGPAITGDAA